MWTETQLSLVAFDDVLNVSGHRIGAAEVESALVAHALVVQAAVVGQPHEIKGAGSRGRTAAGNQGQIDCSVCHTDSFEVVRGSGATGHYLGALCDTRYVLCGAWFTNDTVGQN